MRSAALKGRREICAVIWLENLKKRGNFEDLEADRMIIFNYMLKAQGERAWTGLLWLRIERIDRLL